MQVTSDYAEDQVELLDPEDFTSQPESQGQSRAATYAFARKVTVVIAALASVTACMYLVSSRAIMSTIPVPIADTIQEESFSDTNNPFSVPVHIFSAGEEETCISSRADFAQAWKDPAAAPTLCVSMNLIGHLAHHEYAQNASWGYYGSPVWLLTAYDLEKALIMKKTYGSCPKEDINKLLLGIMQMIGYGGNATKMITKPLWHKKGYDKWFLLVGDKMDFEKAYEDLKPDQRTFSIWQPAFVPTVQGMVTYYGRMGYYVPFLAQRTLTLAYAEMGILPEGQQNPIGVYAKVSGCTYDSMRDADVYPEDRKGCADDYYQFQKALTAQKYCYGECCIKLGYAYLQDQNKEMTSLHLRMMFEQCSASSPLWSGQGLGFSDWPSPFVCMTHDPNPIEHFGGSEQQMAVRFKGDMWNHLERDALEIPCDPESSTKWVSEGSQGFCFDDWKPTRLVDIQDPSPDNTKIFCS